jgi:hypothetical protein
MASIASRDASRLPQQLRIHTLTLDEFAATRRLHRLDFVKADVQGAEPLFLKGGRKTLRQFKPDMCLEVSPEDLAGLGNTSQDLLYQLEEIGYSVFELTQSGRIGPRLHWNTIAPTYASSAVFCKMHAPR